MLESEQVYTMQDVASMLNIGIGRTRLMAFLRVKGLLDSRNHVVTNSALNEHAYRELVHVNRGTRVEPAVRVKWSGFIVIRDLVIAEYYGYALNEAKGKLEGANWNKALSTSVPSILLKPDLIDLLRERSQDGL